MKKNVILTMQFILTFIIIICGILQSADEYPYFTNVEKQLEFEERKIEINEVNEKEMYISGGGSEFNWLSILNPYLDSLFHQNLDTQQPLYLNSDQKASYRYIYTFEITRNGRIIAELEFLKIVGLQDRFDKIVNEYNSEVDVYNKKVEDNKPYLTDKYNKLKQVQLGGKPGTGKILKLSNYALTGYVVFMGLTSMATLALPPNDNPDLKSHYTKASIESPIYLFLFYKFHKWIKNNDTFKYRVKNIIGNPPQLKQTFTAKQLTSIGESYNRTLFDEIRNK